MYYLINNMPLILAKYKERLISGGKLNIRRRLEKADFIEVFSIARKFKLEHPILLKVIDCYLTENIHQICAISLLLIEML